MTIRARSKSWHNVFQGVDLLGTIFTCIDRYMNPEKLSGSIEQERVDSARREAKKFKQMATYAESKRATRLMQEAMKKTFKETSMLRREFSHSLFCAFQKKSC